MAYMYNRQSFHDQEHTGIYNADNLSKTKGNFFIFLATPSPEMCEEKVKALTGICLHVIRGQNTQLVAMHSFWSQAVYVRSSVRSRQ